MKVSKMLSNVVKQGVRIAVTAALSLAILPVQDLQREVVALIVVTAVHHPAAADAPLVVHLPAVGPVAADARQDVLLLAAVLVGMDAHQIVVVLA